MIHFPAKSHRRATDPRRGRCGSPLRCLGRRLARRDTAARLAAESLSAAGLAAVEIVHAEILAGEIGLALGRDLVEQCVKLLVMRAALYVRQLVQERPKKLRVRKERERRVRRSQSDADLETVVDVEAEETRIFRKEFTKRTHAPLAPLHYGPHMTNKASENRKGSGIILAALRYDAAKEADIVRCRALLPRRHQGDA